MFSSQVIIGITCGVALPGKEALMGIDRTEKYGSKQVQSVIDCTIKQD